MLLQTNSYIVPKEKRAEHSRLIRRFRQTLLRLGCDHFEVYEQVGSNWSNSESAGRYVQILRFLDRKHQLAVQSAERTDPTAQAVIADFCDLINFPYQQQQGLFAVGFYTSVLPVAPKRGTRGELVSTVEHEVVNDPEAEKSYPGASDGPPLEETDNGDEPTPAMAGEPAAENEVMQAGSEAADEPVQATGHDEAADGSEDILTAETIESADLSEMPHLGDLNQPESSDEGFMKLVGDELEEEPADHTANGFIEAEPVQKRDSKESPPGW